MTILHSWYSGVHDGLYALPLCIICCSFPLVVFDCGKIIAFVVAVFKWGLWIVKFSYKVLLPALGLIFFLLEVLKAPR
jgi:hypothetical protein